MYANATNFTEAQVAKWLEDVGLGKYTENFLAMEVDGETLLGLTEAMVEKLFPNSMKAQVKFLKARKQLNSELASQEACEPACSNKLKEVKDTGNAEAGGCTDAVPQDEASVSAATQKDTTLTDVDSDAATKEAQAHVATAVPSNENSISSPVRKNPIVYSDDSDDDTAFNISGIAPHNQSILDHDEEPPETQDSAENMPGDPVDGFPMPGRNEEDDDEGLGKVVDDMNGYSLPAFPPTVKLLLDTKRTAADYKVGSNNRRQIINVITADLEHKRKIRPSRKGYKNIMDALFEAYPYLGSAQCWKASLKSKMKTIRSHLPPSTVTRYMKEKYGRPGVSGRKRKNLSHPTEPTPQKRMKLPSQEASVDGEDDASIARHIQDLKVEATKSKPDVNRVMRKLNRTSAYRIKRMYDDDVSILEFLQEFPILRQWHFLVGEVKRSHGFQVEGKSLKLLHSLSELTRFTRYKNKRFRDLWKKYEEAVEETMDASKKSEEGLELAYHLLPSVFGEKEELYLVKGQDDVQSPFPTIFKRKDKYQIVVDGFQVLQEPVGKFSQALEAWFSTHWVFALQYHNQLQRTSLFIERIIMGHNINVPKSIISWASKLNL